MVNHVDRESSFILGYIDPRYSDRISVSRDAVDQRVLSWERVLWTASTNRVLYLFSQKALEDEKLKGTKKAKVLEKIVVEGEKWRRRLRDTIAYVSTTLSDAGLPFLVVKTQSEVPHVTSDVDVLISVEDFYSATKAFSESGATMTRHIDVGLNTGEACVSHPPLLNIELHARLNWLGLKHFDDSFVWSDMRKAAMAEVEFPVPNIEAEFLLNTAHILYKHPLLTMLDFLSMTSYADSVRDWDAILYQTKKYGWSRAFAKFMTMLGSIYMDLYRNPPNWVRTTPERRDITFPLLFSLRFVVETLWERMSVKALMNELTGYYAFALGRYYLSGRRRVPYYANWFPLDKMSFTSLKNSNDLHKNNEYC